MGVAAANGVSIAYEELGDPKAPVILLIMGLGAQLTGWPEDFCAMLVEGGFRVVRFDNRDVGLSSKLEHAGVPNLQAMMMRLAAGEPVEAPYRLGDMADDAIGLMDALEIERAHAVGVSMGGMIAQILAAERGARVASLTSIMSTSGDAGLPQGKPEAVQMLLSRPASDTDLATLVRHYMGVWQVIGSPGYPWPEDELEAFVRRSLERAYYPAGAARQTAAIFASGSRVELLRAVDLPSLVIHGRDDPLIPLAAGEHVAQLIAQARLEVIDGMGHDLAPGLRPRLGQLIVDHCRAADGG